MFCKIKMSSNSLGRRKYMLKKYIISYLFNFFSHSRTSRGNLCIGTECCCGCINFRIDIMGIVMQVVKFTVIGTSSHHVISRFVIVFFASTNKI